MALSTQTTAAGAIYPQPAARDMEAERIGAFRRAKLHSRRVRWLKFLLPVVALAMAAVFVMRTFLAGSPIPEVASDSAVVNDGKLVMSNPKLEGFSKDGRPYLMTATRAVQDFDRQGVVDLEDIEAKLPIDAGDWAMVEASKGVYDRTANTIALESDIVFTTTDGMVAKLASAFLDVGSGSLRTSDPVDIRRQGLAITADSMRMDDNGKLMVFEKRVRMSIVPAGTKSATEASGGTNASN